MDTRPTTGAPAPDTDSGLLLEAVEALSEGLAVFDADRRLVSCNERYVEMLEPIAGMIEPGMRWEDQLQESAAAGLYADANGREAEWLANIGRGLASHSREAEITYSDGRICLVRYNPTASGGFVVVRVDVTESRVAARRAREQEELLRTILDTNPVPVVMARLSDGLILYRSPAALKLFGQTTYAREHYVNAAERDEYVRQVQKHGRVDDYRLAFLDSNKREVEMSSNGCITEYNGERCVVSTLLDLSGHNEQEAIARRVIEACPAPILMTEAETGNVLFRSNALDEMFGHGGRTTEFYIDPSDRRGFLRTLRRTGAVSDYKARFKGADGEPFWGAVSARLIEFEGKEVIVSYSRDLTQQLEVEAELSRQKERLFQNEKMSALGGLLANVAHALNNPLSVVVGHAQMLREESGEAEVVRQAEKIGEAAERCSEIIRTYLTMARQEPVELHPTDINEVVTAALDVARQGGTDDTFSISAQFADDLPRVQADGDQLAQVVLNLLQNASAAIADAGKGGAIRVQTRAINGGRTVRIEVEDDGPGIGKDLAGKIFEPFFTTKDIGEGKGVGLTYCHRVIQTHNGQIRLDPTHVQGAKFEIDLPAEGVDMREDEETSLSDAKVCHILVIDDERDVADLNAEILQRVGYDVAIAYSGADGVEMMNNQRFDVVLSDLNMPDVDGRGFFEIVRQDHPAMLTRTGFITGDTMGQSSQGFLRESKRPYLEKPASPKELRDFVAGILAQGDRE